MKYDESYLPFVGKHKEFFFSLIFFSAEINLLVIIWDECTISLKGGIAQGSTAQRWRDGIWYKTAQL